MNEWWNELISCPTQRNLTCIFASGSPSSLAMTQFCLFHAIDIHNSNRVHMHWFTEELISVLLRAISMHPSGAHVAQMNT
jgi:hypothetical protein